MATGQERAAYSRDQIKDALRVARVPEEGAVKKSPALVAGQTGKLNQRISINGISVTFWRG